MVGQLPNWVKKLAGKLRVFFADVIREVRSKLVAYAAGALLAFAATILILADPTGVVEKIKGWCETIFFPTTTEEKLETFEVLLTRDPGKKEVISTGRVGLKVLRAAKIQLDAMHSVQTTTEKSQVYVTLMVNGETICSGNNDNRLGGSEQILSTSLQDGCAYNAAGGETLNIQVVGAEYLAHAHRQGTEHYLKVTAPLSDVEELQVTEAEIPKCQLPQRTELLRQANPTDTQFTEDFNGDRCNDICSMISANDGNTGYFYCAFGYRTGDDQKHYKSYELDYGYVGTRSFRHANTDDQLVDFCREVGGGTNPPYESCLLNEGGYFAQRETEPHQPE